MEERVVGHAWIPDLSPAAGRSAIFGETIY
jgi:hypothetical protein